MEPHAHVDISTNSRSKPRSAMSQQSVRPTTASGVMTDRLKRQRSTDRKSKQLSNATQNRMCLRKPCWTQIFTRVKSVNSKQKSFLMVVHKRGQSKTRPDIKLRKENNNKNRMLLGFAPEKPPVSPCDNFEIQKEASI